MGVGAGALAVTVTFADALALPPGPVHDNTKLLSWTKAELCSEAGPTALLPAHAPLAAHVCAFVAVHDNVVRPLDATDVGEAVSATVGAAANVTVADVDADPEAFVQVSVYTALAVCGPTCSLP